VAFPTWLPWFLLFFACVFGGLCCLLLGFGVLPRQARDPVRYQAWFQRYGQLLRWLGPFLILLAALHAVVSGALAAPTWLRHALLAAALVSFLLLIVKTWEPEPPVAWPKGVGAWLLFLFYGFVFGAVLSGMLLALGVDLPFGGWRMGGLVLAGLILVRGLVVWKTRFFYRIRRDN